MILEGLETPLQSQSLAGFKRIKQLLEAAFKLNIDQLILGHHIQSIHVKYLLLVLLLDEFVPLHLVVYLLLQTCIFLHS